MRSKKSVITLIDVTPIEVEKGTFEPSESFKDVIALKEELYQSRIETANREGLQLNARFKTRAENISNNLSMVIYKNSKYKVANIFRGQSWTVIELGELI